MDHKSVGLPDVSFHGEKAWCPDFERYSRQLGILQCFLWGKMQMAAKNRTFYTAYNMHWEPYTFALPNLPFRIQLASGGIDTAEDNMNGF